MEAEKDNDDEDIEEERPKIPRLSEWSSVMDDIFDEAVSEGFFDNLPGQGKPLNLNRNPFGQESELAFGLLKHNELTLPWIAERSKLLDEIGKLREEISDVWQEYRQEYEAAQKETLQMELKRSWAEQLDTWNDTIKQLNARIAQTNLKQPGDKLEILKLTLNSELRRAGADSLL